MEEPQHVEAYAWGGWRAALTIPVPAEYRGHIRQDGSWLLLHGTGNTRWLPYSRIRRPLAPGVTAAAVWQWTAARLGQITNFPQADIAKPLYPGVRGTWYELADDKDSQDALALLPEHLHGLLVEGGCVQFCRPSSIRYKHAGWVQPLQGLLQVLVVRAVDLRKSSNPSWSKPFWTPERWQQVVDNLKLAPKPECLPCLMPAPPAGLAAAPPASNKRARAQPPMPQQQRRDAPGSGQAAALPTVTTVVAVGDSQHGALPAPKRRHLQPDSSQQAGQGQRLGQDSSPAGRSSMGAAAAGQVPPGDPGGAGAPREGPQGTGSQQQQPQQGAHSGALLPAVSGAGQEGLMASMSDMHLSGAAPAAAAGGGGGGGRPGPAAAAAPPGAPQQSPTGAGGALPPAPSGAAAGGGGGQAHRSAAAPAPFKGPPITSASSLQPGDTVGLWERYENGVVVVRELLLIRQCGMGGWARVFEAKEVSYQQLQQTDTGQQGAAGNSSNSNGQQVTSAAAAAAAAPAASSSGMAPQQAAPDGGGCYCYAEGGEKQCFTGAPKRPGSGVRLALKVSFGWDDLNDKKQEEAGGDAAVFATEQCERFRQELALAQLAAMETPLVIASYGVGTMHRAPGVPLSAAATPLGAAPAAAAAGASGAPPAATSAAAAAASSDSGQPAADLQGVLPGPGGVLQQQPLNQQPLQLPVCGILMELATCTLSQYTRCRQQYPGVDVPPVDGMLLGLRHSEKLRTEAKAILCQVISALLSLEKIHVLHRDVKAENVLLKALAAPAAATPAPGAAAAAPQAAAAAAAGPDWPAVGQGCISWCVKLADFGVACQTSTVMPRAIGVAGTITNMPAEVVMSSIYTPNEYGTETNTWAVGALFLEILTGFAPLWFITNPEPSQRANIKAQLRRPGTPYAQHLTEDDKTFLELCLERNPGRRLVLAQLLADPWVKQYLGWPAGWKVDGSPPTFLAG